MVMSYKKRVMFALDHNKTHKFSYPVGYFYSPLRSVFRGQLEKKTDVFIGI